MDTGDAMLIHISFHGKIRWFFFVCKNQNKVGCEKKLAKTHQFWGKRRVFTFDLTRKINKGFCLPLQNLFLWIFLKKLRKIRCQLISHEIWRGWSWHGRHWHCCRGCLLLWRSLLCTSCCGCCTATVQPHHGLLINFDVTKFRFITFWTFQTWQRNLMWKLKMIFFCFSGFDFQVKPTKCCIFTSIFR